ncbi:MAG: flippase [Fidelibacterota bacterium]
MNSSSKIVKEATVSFTGMTFGQVIRYVFTVLLARLVGADYLGIYSLANSLTRIFEVFGKVGLDAGIMRFVSTGDDRHSRIADIQAALKMSIIFSFFLMVTQILLAGWIVMRFFHGNDILRMTLLIFAVSLPFSVFILVAGSASQGFQLLKYKIFVSQILVPIVLLLAMIGVYKTGYVTYTISLPILISSVAGSVVIFYFLTKQAGITLSGIAASRFNRALLRFSYPLMFISILGTIMHWTDILMLGYFYDETVVGLYHPAARTAGLIRSVMLSFTGIFAPMMGSLFASHDQQGMQKLFQLIVRWILTIAGPIAIIFLLFPGKTMLLFGNEFLASRLVLIVLTLAVLIQAFFGPGGSVLTMTGYPKYNLMNSIITIIVNISLNIMLIPKYGAIGAAMATLASFFLIGFIRLFEIKHLIQIHPFSLKLLKPITAGGITIVGIMFIRPWFMPFHTVLTLVLAGIAIVIIFGGFLWLMGFDEDDKSVLGGLTMIKDRIYS